MDASPLARAVAAVGGSAHFIRAVGISPRTLASWRASGVPDTRWREVAQASLGAVTMQELAIERATKHGATVEAPARADSVSVGSSEAA